jgi:glycosyltransferase involved in cell wall biosynthesis
MNILHIIRKPMGGAWRHVLDLARGQRARGYSVGLIADFSLGKKINFSDDELVNTFDLGCVDLSMPEMVGSRDVNNLVRIKRVVHRKGAKIVHGHGAKGGIYARLCGCLSDGCVFYTSHGGALHYDEKSVKGRLFFEVERVLQKRTSGLIFESMHAQDLYFSKVGMPSCAYRQIYNGISFDEFLTRPAKSKKYDLGYIGELRHLKGVEDLLKIVKSSKMKSSCRLVIAGTGQDEGYFKQFVSRNGLENRVDFIGYCPVWRVVGLAELFVIPSRAETLGYVALELLAAGAPVVANDVGGLKEVFKGAEETLIRSRDPDDVADYLVEILNSIDEYQERLECTRRKIRKTFSMEKMTSSTAEFYMEELMKIQ